MQALAVCFFIESIPISKTNIKSNKAVFKRSFLAKNTNQVAWFFINLHLVSNSFALKTSSPPSFWGKQFTCCPFAKSEAFIIYQN